MYEKNLTEDLRLRLSSIDMEFLKGVAIERNDSISSVIRSIIGEYRRSIILINSLSKITNDLKGEDVHGNTKTNFND